MRRPDPPPTLFVFAKTFRRLDLPERRRVFRRLRSSEAARYRCFGARAPFGPSALGAVFYARQGVIWRKDWPMRPPGAGSSR
jgi:hypothetical protein